MKAQANGNRLVYWIMERNNNYDGYRIRLDVSEIIRDVEKAIDKSGEL